MVVLFGFTMLILVAALMLCVLEEGERTMNRTRVYWNVKKLAREYNLSPTMVGRLLSKIGAKRWTTDKTPYSVWYWDAEEEDSN